MDGFEGNDPSTMCGTVCHCLMWALVCITCPISLPLLGLCWCCQEVCPIGPDAFFGLGDHDEATYFASTGPDDE